MIADTKILTNTQITPEIAAKMRIDQFQKVKCKHCEHTYQLGQLPQPSLYLENITSGKFRPPSHGGNGYNFRCPNCRYIIYAPRW
jgi:predicted methyltransferase